MCLAQGHNTVTLVKLEPVVPRLESSSLPLSHCAPPILLLQWEGQALYIVYKVLKPAPGPKGISSFGAQLN